ncbi:hypothetical protein V8C44DRAFT_336246 [Trichoderma aethiopicum]
MSLCMRRGTGQINQLDATRTIPSRGVVAAGSRTPYFRSILHARLSLSGPLCSRTPLPLPFLSSGFPDGRSQPVCPLVRQVPSSWAPFHLAALCAMCCL